ncbi:testis-expressed protein 50 isoform X2 [Fukomys damarensis]|uniref:testis-expressed protein 50 isoform X2 n=1 Tax=Fukomys damarensis TaxID=885580 RepID=UPI00053F6B80|nr:testis-expressed protein 50 isoform X2 [Fukomys damarensis]
MSNLGPSLTFPLLLFIFFRDSFCICNRTTWTKAGWEIFPEEVHYLKVKTCPPRCLPYPLNKLCCNFANVDIFQSCLHLTFILAPALFLIMSILSVHYLWMKWKKHQKKLKKQASFDKVESDLKSPSFCDIDQMLCKVLATSSMMNKYLKHVSQRCSSKKDKKTKVQQC